MAKWIRNLLKPGGFNVKYLQQGDTLYFPESLPKDLIELKTKVVQEGEHTGHAHRLYDDEAIIYEEPKTKMKYLKIVKPTALKHEEHPEIMIPPGTYRVGIVREVDHFENEIRKVMD